MMKEDKMKLYRVNLRGLTNATGVQYNSSYVVADDTAEAYKRVRKWLDDEDYGFSHERELESVELLADEYEYNDVKTRLFL